MAKQTRDPFPHDDEIAARAQQLFRGGGGRIAMIPEYWRAAERELLEQAAKRVIPSGRQAKRARR